MPPPMNSKELTDRLCELNKSIRFDKQRIKAGREIIKMLLDQTYQSEKELRKVKAELKRLDADRELESRCSVDLNGIWGRLNELGLSKKEIYVLQNLDSPYREIGGTIGVSVERVRQIAAKALRRCRHKDVIKAVTSEVEDAEYDRNTHNFFISIQEQEADGKIFRYA